MDKTLNLGRINRKLRFRVTEGKERLSRRVIAMDCRTDAQRGWTMPEHYALDYEVLPENHEGMICVVMIRLMLRRLANNRRTRTYNPA